MGTIPSYRSAHLMPYLEFFRGMGAPLESHLRTFHLPTMITDGDDIYLPQIPTIAFLKKMAQSQGIDEMPLMAQGSLHITDLSEHFVATAYQSPTLKMALDHFRKLAPLEDPDVEFWMIPGEGSVRLCMTNHFPLDQQGMRFEDWNELLVLMAIVQGFAGPDWQPEEMAFRSDLPLSRYASEQYPNTRFMIGQEAVWITVPLEMLSLPPLQRSEFTEVPLSSITEPRSSANTGDELANSLRQVLPAYLADGYPSIQIAAQIAGTSVRTLQRKLKDSSVSYSELVQHARMDMALKLLRTTDKKIIDISYQLGYEDPAHFTRSFVRQAGICPREYRKQHLH